MLTNAEILLSLIDNEQARIQEFTLVGAPWKGEGSGDHQGPQRVQGSTRWGALRPGSSWELGIWGGNGNAKKWLYFRRFFARCETATASLKFQIMILELQLILLIEFSRRFSSYWTYRFSLLPLSSPPLSLSLFSFFFFFRGGGRRERPRLNPRLMSEINTHILWFMHYSKEYLIFNQYDIKITLGALCITTLIDFLP